MNRGDAYNVLAKELESLRQQGYDAMRAEIGQPAKQRLVQIGHENAMVETSANWADEKKCAVRLTASALGSSCWTLDRLDESIVIHP